VKIKEIGAFEAKTHLSKLLEKVEHGQVYRITRRGRVIAELRPVDRASRLSFGSDRGAIVIGDDFDAPLAEFVEYER
jgi:prevent-host-death family protein